MPAYVMLTVAPLAQASCHGCVDAVAEDCASLVAADCAGSATHLATHMPQHAMEVAGDPEGFACEVVDEPGCG